MFSFENLINSFLQFSSYTRLIFIDTSCSIFWVWGKGEHICRNISHWSLRSLKFLLPTFMFSSFDLWWRKRLSSFGVSQFPSRNISIRVHNSVFLSNTPNAVLSFTRVKIWWLKFRMIFDQTRDVALCFRGTRLFCPKRDTFALLAAGKNFFFLGHDPPFTETWVASGLIYYQWLKIFMVSIPPNWMNGSLTTN